MPSTPLPAAERILSMVASDKRPNIYHQFGISEAVSERVLIVPFAFPVIWIDFCHRAMNDDCA